VVRLLSDARQPGHDLIDAARAICQAQPSMASVWNAVLEALASTRAPDRFDRFVQRLSRSSDALTRVAAEFLTIEKKPGPLRLVTFSFSGTVASVIEEVCRRREAHIACSEGRPALEGQRLAARLAAAGAQVDFFTDAALAEALADADAVLTGTDALAPDWFVNKSGTRLLAAAAAEQVVPVYVLATREKFVGRALGKCLILREGPADEVWVSPPAGVAVRNPYFEMIPLHLVSNIISDIGVLEPGMVRDVCESASDPLILEALEQLGVPS
jgi:translation initiation factor 2B subunit (eIF-2B alpha/beta/delta family)